MGKVGRRAFLKGATVAAAGAGSVKASAGLLGNWFTPTLREDHNVIVVGSGFGGGVSALRLGEAGAKVTVLERGKWWPAGPNADTFPSTKAGLDERALWYNTSIAGVAALNAIPSFQGVNLPLKRHAGILDPIVSPNMTVVCAAGVGGGSLAYQGMTLQPNETVFNNVFKGDVDYQEMDEVFYPMVADMLQIATAPDTVVNHPNYRAPRNFKARAEAAGYSVEKIPMPIDWSFVERELAGEMTPSFSDGDCALGVNNGGKNSVDETYIKQTLATGNVTVNALHNVTSVAKAADGRWVVNVDQTDVEGNVLVHKVLTCNALIMAAGCVGSIKLLQRANYRGDIPGLPAALGRDWGTNGDRIIAWSSPTDSYGAAQGGPVVFGSKEWDDPALANTVIQASLPPLGFDASTTMMVGFGYTEARGRWFYNPLTDDSILNWDREADAYLHQRIMKRMYDIAGVEGILIDTHVPVPMTWHPLGGVSMGLCADTEGRVFDQDGLYVLDGALVPGNTGACNPSMTIAAIAERAIHYLIREEGQKFGVSPSAMAGGNGKSKNS